LKRGGGGRKEGLSVKNVKTRAWGGTQTKKGGRGGKRKKDSRVLDGEGKSKNGPTKKGTGNGKEKGERKERT